MSRLAALARRTVLVAACWPAVGPVAAATIRPLDLARPEGPRHVLVAEPVPAPAPAGPRPLVVLLHGHGGTAAQLLGQQRGAAPLSRWLVIADREGWLLAAPDGAKGADGRPGWNDCRADAADNPHTDDVGLVAALIDEMVAHHGADPARVYVMGMSNGGIMSFRLASELRFLTRQSRGAVLGAEATAERWRRLAGLPAEPARHEAAPHRDAADRTRATRSVWGADPAGAQVELLRIDGGGHIEPSLAEHPHRAYTALVGPQNTDVEAAEEAFVFFKDKRAAAR
ncbi:MAG: PHB depolymerase family esterase [Burkholderiaceae bacterium]